MRGWRDALAGRLYAPQAIASVLMLLALNPGNPYGYYTFLRLACCAVFGFLAYTAHTQGRLNWAWGLGAVALLYNPFIPIHLPRDTWAMLNVGTIAIALASIRGLDHHA